MPASTRLSLWKGGEEAGRGGGGREGGEEAGGELPGGHPRPLRVGSRCGGAWVPLCPGCARCRNRGSRREGCRPLSRDLEPGKEALFSPVTTPAAPVGDLPPRGLPAGGTGLGIACLVPGNILTRHPCVLDAAASPQSPASGTSGLAEGLAHQSSCLLCFPRSISGLGL